MHVCCLVAPLSVKRHAKNAQWKFWLGTAQATGGDNAQSCLTNFAAFREETSQEVIKSRCYLLGSLHLLLAVLDYFT